MRDDIIMLNDGWYWMTYEGVLVGPFETRAEAIGAADSDEDECWAYEEAWEN